MVFLCQDFHPAALHSHQAFPLFQQAPLHSHRILLHFHPADLQSGPRSHLRPSCHQEYHRRRIVLVSFLPHRPLNSFRPSRFKCNQRSVPVHHHLKNDQMFDLMNRRDGLCWLFPTHHWRRLSPNSKRLPI